MSAISKYKLCSNGVFPHSGLPLIKRLILSNRIHKMVLELASTATHFLEHHAIGVKSAVYLSYDCTIDETDLAYL